MKKKKTNNLLLLTLIVFIVLLLLFSTETSSTQYLEASYDMARLVDDDVSESKKEKNNVVTSVGILGERAPYSGQKAKDLSSLSSNNERHLAGNDFEAAEYAPNRKFVTNLTGVKQARQKNNRQSPWDEECGSNCYVHVTPGGSIYHSADCKYLIRGDIKICKDDAMTRGYTCCTLCGGVCDVSRTGDGDRGVG
ncbi:MAG: hypothetical protein JSU72_07215 [Deltaproteobacteria bacterium]|nr:MAG: hypothetical protein JSU72_07215 [Deltaproteobacteria bacterium]